MAKWYGNIGYAETVEIERGVYDERITERPYYGDITRNTHKLQSNSSSTNDDVNLTMEISIVADPYAYEHFYSMRYIEYMGAKWKINNVSVQYPRLILSTGGVYNG